VVVQGGEDTQADYPQNLRLNYALLTVVATRAVATAKALGLDPVHRENLAKLREFWISLANARPFLSEGDFVKQAEAIGRFHANL
jgi:hypothetical protein